MVGFSELLCGSDRLRPLQALQEVSQLTLARYAPDCVSLAHDPVLNLAMLDAHCASWWGERAAN